MPRHVDEPLTFTYVDVANTLAQLGYERMARHVKRLGEDNRDKNLLEREWAGRCQQLVDRLQQYEPPALRVADNGGKPGPMSDG